MSPQNLPGNKGKERRFENGWRDDRDHPDHALPSGEGKRL